MTSNGKQFIQIFKNSLKITPRTISIKTLLSERNLRRIDYKPYYQRNYVWDNVKQSFFIESVILGTEIPPLILFKSGTRVEVIDGRQRFETLKKFIENDISLTEKGLLSLPALDKQNFNKLKEEVKDIFWNANIRVFEFEVLVGIDTTIEDKIKKEIFRRYNTGITPLTSIEVDSAKYDNDDLSEIIEKELTFNVQLYQKIRKSFFPNEVESEDLKEKIIDILRKVYVLPKFPISRYARGAQRTEIFNILYETAVNNSDDLVSDFQKLKGCLNVLFDLQSSIEENIQISGNKLLSECLLWAILILENEGKSIDYTNFLNQINEHYKLYYIKYSDENSYFYKAIITRFEDTAELFSKISGLNFDIFLRKNDFVHDLKKIRQSDSDAKDIIKILESLRINKPSPVSRPIEEILSDVITNKYLIRPSYQRQEKISEIKASSIIESILLGIYLPPLFIFKRKDGTKEVIDGQQRLLAIIAFVGKQYRNENNLLTYSINNNFKLKKLNILVDSNSSNYNSLPEIEKDKILDFVVDEIIIEESLNEGFEPTDLFIRLNQKPYPINNNSFEMWNSTVDKEIINRIKDVTGRYVTWFYSKENIDIRNRTDRMENEELVTILSYIIHVINREGSYEKVLGLFLRSDRITCRLKNKSAITDYLNKLEDNYHERESFLKSIDRTESLIVKFGEMIGGELSKEAVNTFFNVKKSKTFRRSFQDFYITWLILDSWEKRNLDGNLDDVRTDIRDLLVLLKNVDSVNVDENYFDNFIIKLNSKTVY